MIIPKKLKVGGHIIIIDCTQELENRNGEFVITKNLIKICKTLPQSQKEITLIHELFHAMQCGWSDSAMSHLFLESMSQQLYQVLTDNKLLK